MHTPFSHAVSAIHNSPSKTAWDRIGVLPKHGICVPVFSLHSQQSCGIGEYLDLIPLITWCQNQGLHILQILPINDPGEDSSPYNSISSIALNPLYLSLSALPAAQEMPGAQEDLQVMRQFNALPYVHYDLVKKHKWLFLKKYVDFVQKRGALEAESFLIFCEREHYWLEPYTLFRAIKQHLQGAPINNWPKEYTNKQNFPLFAKTFAQEQLFYAYIQYLCFQQMEHVRRIADEKHVLLKGDLPILISKDSCDVWYFRQYFSSSGSVGSPPDLYNTEGQNWHLPIYNMKALAADQYSWWKARLRYAENFYSLYRLDHIVGFFRLWIWDNKGSGKFEPESKKEYLKQGTDILTHLLRFSKMLPIGEDLGSIPEGVRETLFQLGICGTRIPRWERRWDTDGGFIPFDQYTPLSVTTFSTHDSTTLSLWWKESPEEAKQFARTFDLPFSPSLSKELQKDILTLSHHTSSIFHINLLNDYLALCPDLVASDQHHERINRPGTISKFNWVYRMKPKIDSLLTHQAFNQLVHEIIS